MTDKPKETPGQKNPLPWVMFGFLPIPFVESQLKRAGIALEWKALVVGLSYALFALVLDFAQHEIQGRALMIGNPERRLTPPVYLGMLTALGAIFSVISSLWFR